MQFESRQRRREKEEGRLPSVRTALLPQLACEKKFKVISLARNDKVSVIQVWWHTFTDKGTGYLAPTGMTWSISAELCGRPSRRSRRNLYPCFKTMKHLIQFCTIQMSVLYKIDHQLYIVYKVVNFQENVAQLKKKY